MTIYGYVRVSTKEQKEDRQRLALEAAGVKGGYIYEDRLSGKDFDRPSYRRLVRKMKKGDILYVKSIDRLGRNYRDLLEEWRYLTGQKGIDIVILDMPLLDTRRGKDLVGLFLSDVVLQILSFVAENERALLQERQREGIEAAKKRGVRFGRPPHPVPAVFQKMRDLWRRKEITGAEAARRCAMPLSTVRRKAMEQE